MTNDLRQKNKRGLIVGIFFCISLLVGCAVFSIILLSDKNIREACKSRLVILDSHYFNGVIRRIYHRQSLPQLPDSPPKVENGHYSWLQSDNFIFIAHGLGPKLFAGANSLLTMQQGIEIGFKFFEVDIALTSDGYLVCYQGNSEEDLDQMTYSKYMDIMREEKVAPLLFSDLVATVREMPNIRIILDVKNRFNETYAIIRREIGDQSYGKLFIPQIYFFEQLKAFREDNFFAGEIFTSYRSALTTKQIIESARHFGIKAVTLTMKRFDEIRGNIPSDLYIMTHPVNDPFQADGIIHAGGRGIYTNYITPRTFPDLFNRN